MRPYMNSSNYLIMLGEKPMASKYNLQGVVLHRGRIEGGHYWAHIKDGINWYSADDEEVIPLPTNDVVE